MWNKKLMPFVLFALVAVLAVPMVGCEREAEVETPYGETEVETEPGVATGTTGEYETREPGTEMELGMDDAGITATVKSKLTADPDVNPFNINVTTENGVVTLQGDVEKEAAKTAAERLARDTEGVQSVVNEINVTGEDA